MINTLPHNSTSTTGRLFVISGPSGVGKGTLVAAAQSALPDLAFSVSATTRSPRKGEVDGIDYHFVSDDEFDQCINEGQMLEWAEVHGRRYGTYVSEVRRALDRGQDLILEIDPQGNEQVKRLVPEAYSIFIAPPSFEELRSRIERRAADGPESIEQRLSAAQVELDQQDSYNVVIVNDDLDDSIQTLVQIINEQRLTHRADDGAL